MSGESAAGRRHRIADEGSAAAGNGHRRNGRPAAAAFSLVRLLQEAGDPHSLYAQAVNPQFVRVLRAIGFDRGWVRADGSYLEDSDGRRFLDLLGGFGMFPLGRNNEQIRAALEEALALQTPGSVQLGLSPLPGLLARELLTRVPPRLGRVLFTNSGTEAVEAAIKLGRAATGRSRVISADGAFHGLTLGSLSAGGCEEFTAPFHPLLPGFSRVPLNDLDALERELLREDVALFLVEPIQGKGVVFPAPGYLEGAQELCRRYGTLFAVDEVQTGLGRTGRLFAFQEFGLQPDILTVAKGLSGGYVPSGACLVRADVFDSVFDSLEHAVRHGSTFAPNDLAMAAGLAVLHELDEQNLVARARRLGDLLLEWTEPLCDRYGVVQDVRGLGLMWGIEFGEPARRRTSWRLLERAQQGIFAQLVVGPLFHEHRMLTQVAGHGLNVLKILPPLTIAETDLERFVMALDAVIARAQKIPSAAVRMALRAGVHFLTGA
jgi:ornithine--oxo-acid transaminase